MIQIRKAEERGHADHGWLDAHHTFSFADYYDPDFVHFGPLRVLNQDRIQAGRGFPTHGHENMEIITYVLAGALEHKDSMGNGSRMQHGEVQFMSAGSGVQHSERNPSPDEELHLLQMWVFPEKNGTEPRYEQRAFDVEVKDGNLRLVVSPDGREDSLTIGQDAQLFAATLEVGEEARHSLSRERLAWLHLATGRIELNGQTLEAGDGAAIREESLLELRALDKAELVLWDLPDTRPQA